MMNFARFSARKYHENLAPSFRNYLKAKIVARETIKPSSPTPERLRHFKLSIMDQLGPTAFCPTVLLFSSGTHADHIRFTPSQQSQMLKESLSETLTSYYPLAGRLKDNTFIDCNDSGADYLEAEVDSSLSSFLNRPYAEGLEQLIPIQSVSTEANSKLFLAQASFFGCGSMAVGVCLSHKLSDERSVSTFLKDWAATALGTKRHVPVFNQASIIPPGNFSSDAAPSVTEVNLTNKTVLDRFVFDLSDIQALQAKSANSEVTQPTRVEAVTALIWKCAMKASRKTTGISKPSIAAYPIDIRKRVTPQLHKNSIGNLASFFAVEAEENNQTMLQTLVSRIRKGKQEFSENHAKKLRGNPDVCQFIRDRLTAIGSKIANGNFDFYIFSSTCRFGLYETDFGWGKPTWATLPSIKQKNQIVLMDTNEPDGIEAWVCLGEEEMKFFKQDNELSAFASLNPSVSDP